MKNILNAIIDEARNLVITPSEGFAGEHNAEVLEIDIGPFATDGYDYFILNFENFCADGKLISNIIRTENDEPSYIANGVIFCPLTAQLTASGKLKLQLEAHKNTESGEIVRKSSVAELSFKPSVMGADDMINSGNSVYGRLEEIEGAVEAVEKRVDALEAENFGAKIKAADENAQGAHEKADVLDGRVDTLEAETEQTKKRIATVEGYKIPESFDAIEGRVRALEDKPEGLDEIPFATENSVGGFILSNTSPVELNADGTLALNYSNLNIHTFSALFILALISETGMVETVAGKTCGDISGFVYDCSVNVLSDIIKGVAFAVFNRGTIEYLTSDYENVTINAEANHVYVISKKDGITQVDDYFGTDLRQLILEGI